jgi:hypothetical protein
MGNKDSFPGDIVAGGVKLTTRHLEMRLISLLVIA